MDDTGLAVIQQRHDPVDKIIWWSDTLYLHPKFIGFFEARSGRAMDGLYPTVTIRQIMWALKLKPLPRERWEACFDRKII